MGVYDIALFKGHGKYAGGFDPGTVRGSIREYDIVSEIVDEAVRLLKGVGLSVLTGENNYNNVLLRGHTIKSKCAYSVHVNAGGGKRTEFFVPKGESYFELENKIGKDMVTLGIPTYMIKSRDYNTEEFINRTDGVKLNGTDYYKEIREAWGMGISLTIFETGFIDSTDINVIISKKKEIAFILAKHLASLCGKTLDKPVEKPIEKPVVNTGGVYRVIVGSFKDKSNAIKQQENLKKAGFDSFLEYKK